MKVVHEICLLVQLLGSTEFARQFFCKNMAKNQKVQTCCKRMWRTIMRRFSSFLSASSITGQATYLLRAEVMHDISGSACNSCDKYTSLLITGINGIVENLFSRLPQCIFIPLGALDIAYLHHHCPRRAWNDQPCHKSSLRVHLGNE